MRWVKCVKGSTHNKSYTVGKLYPLTEASERTKKLVGNKFLTTIDNYGNEHCIYNTHKDEFVQGTDYLFEEVIDDAIS